ncbi:MAG: DUF2752 domain-containing protein [bacterium]|nr:DUF2752 domain-containing protein [bacterium]
MPKRLHGACVLVGGLAAALILRLCPFPDDPRWSPCLFRRVTGLPCATCGLTRSLASLAHGSWQRAYAYHPLGLPVALLLGTAWVALSWFWLREQPIPPRLVRAWLLACLAVAVVAFILWLTTVVFPTAAAFWHH